ncbi:DUF4864 domain-containing protein [Roseobacter sp. HKCCD9010]|uniref:DUF4864 domain-containing protein n=1 Tax=unclassified Roseobacter TaxID=196798 RepID=UPI0014919359|nr:MULTISPECIES: DUF4864 domain-containing protein [unclassified Roseobacter]MBF9051561.1 DUF4864 domain-containing protein [Rhodobacterales bacterium HKCCD4356]NNV13085.1 DUF4864 domain-containing protein [Roseobacter sp. HKCCD7357]NNV17336.1 DUF4864 domain-containing protein [Roseobacter sp. HKCCD8768]NNV26942.1 DUF4864 domain-containing protein [Roseobacter sp. HKCCD8192]NNV31062.1 DUF4864 domain-containing protein [Roseobacter sp. HKCCD9061]
MRRIYLAMMMICAGAVAAAQEVLAPNPAIERTIQNQFEAFLADDVDDAWTYASPNIQRLFQTPERFGRMVEEGYPMVWRPGQIDYLDLQTLGGLIVQRVQIIDGQGVAHVLGYQMIETEAGWQINGVRLLRASQVGA